MIRPYDPERDHAGAVRTWAECGWVDPDEEDEVACLDVFLEGGEALVSELNGEVECLGIGFDGDIQHTGTPLQLVVIGAVTTSRVARKQGLGSRITAAVTAAGVARGAVVSALGIFDQGYYDRLGYGLGCYDGFVRVDPRQLRVPYPGRPPVRLTVEDFERIHACRLRGRAGHGAVSVRSPLHTRESLMEAEDGFGLGFCDGEDGALSHFVWIDNTGDDEYGPAKVHFQAFETMAQYVELLGVLRSLADQYRGFRLYEPPGVQLQALLREPFRNQGLTHGLAFRQGNAAVAWAEYRMNDSVACLAATTLPGNEVLRFALQLEDPIGAYLPDDAPWRGCGGAWTITLGPESSAVSGHEGGLPLLEASVNAFTRLWMGVCPASGLTVTDGLKGDPALIAALDARIRLPTPRPDWDF